MKRVYLESNSGTSGRGLITVTAYQLGAEPWGGLIEIVQDQGRTVVWYDEEGSGLQRRAITAFDTASADPRPPTPDPRWSAMSSPIDPRTNLGIAWQEARRTRDERLRAYDDGVQDMTRGRMSVPDLAILRDAYAEANANEAVAFRAYYGLSNHHTEAAVPPEGKPSEKTLQSEAEAEATP